MKKLLWLLLFIPSISIAQSSDTTFSEYIALADSAYSSDDDGLQAYRWYIAAVILARDNGVADEQVPTLAYLHERVGLMSYDYNLFDYAIIYYESSFSYYRELGDEDAISRVIPKIALAYQGMRNQKKSLPPPEADEFVTAEVYYRIISEPEYHNGKVYVEINGGISDGIYENSIGYAYGVAIPNIEGRGALRLGDAAIFSLDTNSTIIEITTLGIDDSLHTIYNGDMVQMLSLIPKEDYRSKIWELAIDQIIFLNEAREPIYDYRMLLKYDGELLQDEILEIMRRDIYSTWEWLRDLEDKSTFENIFNDKATRGRYAGYTVFEAMEKTTTDDILAFLGFVHSYPGKYMGIPYKINETYATWLLNECYIGFDEFLAMMLAAETDEDYKKIVETYYEEITEDEFFIRMNMHAEDYAENNDIETARSINARVIKMSEFIDDKAYLGWAYFNKGRIYDYANNNDTSVFYYEMALPYFERTGDMRGVAFCKNNLASIYEDWGEYEKANSYYRSAFIAKKNLLKDPESDESNTFYSMAKSSSGIANTEYLLANYDSSLAAYDRGIAYSDSAASLEGKEYAVSLITDMARVYKKRGQYGLASGLYEEQVKRYAQLGKKAKVADALDNVADVLFSKGDYQAALTKYLEAKTIKLTLEDYTGAGFSMSNCGQAMWNLGDLDSAIAFHKLAIEYRQKDNDIKGVAYAYAKIGALFKELGYADQAAEYYGESIQTYYDYGDSLKVAELSIDLGDFYESLKNYTAALEYYDKALNMYEARGMKSDAAYVRSYKGYVFYLLRDYNQAEELYRNALTIRKEINERQSIMYSLVDLSSIMLYAKYDMDTALILLNEAMALAKETESSDYEAYCHEYIGHAYYFRAETDSATQNYESAFALYTENGNVTGQCNMLLNLGASELQRGEFEKALALYNQSLQLAREGSLSLQVANTYNYLAEYYYYTGEFNKAFEVIDSSYVLFTNAGNEYGIANTHVVDGNTHNLIGNASASFDQYELADSIYVHLKDPISRSTAINNMGTIKFFQGDYNEALRLFARCRGILDSVNVKSALLSTVTGNIGEVYMEKGIWDESEGWLDDAINIATEMGATRDVWGHKTLYAKLLYKQGKYNESIDLLDQCIVAFRKSDEKMAIAEIATTLGKSHRALGEYSSARNYFDEAIDLYKEIGSKKLIWDPLYNLALVEKAEENNLASIALLKEAVDTLENLSNDIVGDGANKKLFAKADDKKGIYLELITQLVETGEVGTAFLYQEKLNVYGLQEQTRGEPTRGVSDANDEEVLLDELQLQADGIYAQLMKEKAKPADQRSEDKIKELETRMSIASEKYQNFFWDLVDNGVIQNDFSNTINPEELDQLRYDLDEDIVILEYLATDNQLIIFVASFDTLGAKVIDISKENLETYINGYYALLTGQADFEALDKASHELYKVLIQPVDEMIQDKDKIAFIPTGNMFKLPFQSLGTPIDDGMHYLIEDYQVFYLNDIRSTMVQGGFDPNSAKLIAFGNADSTLIHAEKEVNMILETFPTADVYIKKQAKEDVAKTSMNDYQIVHFATHGNLDPINFSNSYLTMAPNLDAGEDGKLTMREINRIRTLRGCELIVLSACNTAVNDEKLNGWINNPAKAFLRKGAKTAVASLWSVDDAATGRMMQNFYKNMKDGQTKVEALTNAQRELVTSSFFGHPYYWAAFELIGQWE